MATATVDAPSLERDTQWVCALEMKFCPCTDDDDGGAGELTCSCEEKPVDGKCGRCGSPMVLIDTNTGEPVGAVAQ